MGFLSVHLVKIPIDTKPKQKYLEPQSTKGN